jgi:hypothetical protein
MHFVAPFCKNIIMKQFNILLLCLAFSKAFSQEIPEKEIQTVVNEVTVFIDGAQITRKKAIDLPQGKTVLKFVNLSPFIDAKSIQVKADGEVTVLSVNHQQNFLDKSEKSVELVNLIKKSEEIEENLKLENTYLSIIREELAFLQENRDLGGRNQELSITNLKEAAAFYSDKLTELKLKEIERNKKVLELTRQKGDIENQIRALAAKKEFPTGEILVKTDARKATRVSIEVSYLVANTSWFPSYDIRAKNVNEPVEIIYKANVRQDTKEDWKDVKLRFSSSDPNKTGVAPELQTYFLNYYTQPPVYNRDVNAITGRVFDNNNEPMPGVNVMVEGTTIGTVTDVNGAYSITLPNNISQLQFSFVGYQSRSLPVNSAQMNVVLNEDIAALSEVVVMGYGTANEDITGSSVLQGKAAGVSVRNRPGNLRIRGVNNIAIPSARIERQTTVDFEIKTPYTILSDNKSYTVDMEVYELPAYYQYYCVPKVDKDAFLIAGIVDWEKYNLLEGEANIFFEDTYIGKTLLDVRYASDTLDISLGRDKNVSVNREKVKDFITKQFLGVKKEETRDWLITVKNNKSQVINMVLLDQAPVSTVEEIEVEVQKTSGAKLNAESGEVKWEFVLEPNSKKDLELKYAVKYPKYQNLVIE